ncbi:MAG: kelch repeat-containing protein, partial [Candidatus Sulfotelmatobacter sp.]
MRRTSEDSLGSSFLAIFFPLRGEIEGIRQPASFRALRLLFLCVLVFSSLFAFSQAPVLTSVSPTAWSPGMQVMLTGTGFGASANGSSGGVYLSGGAYPAIVSWSDTQVVFTVPTGIGPGSVLVFQTYLNSNWLSYTMIPPVLTSVSPTVWTPGMQVTLTGSGFGAAQGGGGVYFVGSGQYGTVVSWSATQVVFTVPSELGSSSVLVFQNGANSNSIAYTMIPPVLTSVSPTAWAPGMQVTLTGSGFGATMGNGSVYFCCYGVYGAIVSWSDTQIVFTVPSVLNPGTVLVNQNGVNSNQIDYMMIPPVLTSISPTAVAPGMQVTLTGSGFGTVPYAVIFGGTAVWTFTSWTDTQIVVTVPSEIAPGNVSVVQNGVYSNSIAYTVQSDPFIGTTGEMEASLYGQTATELTTGQVLIAGGMSTSGVENSAELYTPTSESFAPAANAMNVARWLHSATLLNDGTVLIAGGSSLSNETTLNSAEIYDPVAGTFTLLPNTLNTARVGHTATLLSNGQVLIVGGYDPATGIISDAELYDPTAQVFIDLGNTNTPRFHHTATLLQNGQVLITGGETDPTPSAAYNTAEIFNPATWTFTALSVNMTTAREGHAATLLNNGQVLITGGDLPAAGSLNTAEIYDPVANAFTAVSATMTSPRIYHDAVLLNGGTILLSGGENDSGGNSTALNTAEVYNPTSQMFTAVTGNMTSAREHQTATLLNDGTVLEDGGTDGTNVFNTAEIYTASQLTGLTSIAISPATPSVPVGTQQLLVATGTFNGGSTQVLSSVLWSSSSSSVFAISNDASDTGFATSAAQGSGTVTASAAGISGSTTVTVPAPTLVSITLNPQSLAMRLGTTQQFTATGTYSDGSTQDLTSTATWTSSSSSAAVNSAGLVTGASLGNSTIQASSGSQSASTTVAVGGPALVALALTPSTASIAVGITQQYQVTGTYTDGSTQNLTSSVSWSAVPLTTASVTSGGLASGVGQGTAVVTVTTGTFDAVGTLAVGAPGLVSIAVVPSAATIPPGSVQQFTATGHYTDGSTQDITSSSTWTTSNANAVGVTGSGLASALASGISTISASYSAITGTASLTVETNSAGLNTSRYQHNATLLNNGTVLVVGGLTCPSVGSCTYLNSAELYTPSAGTFAATGSMATARSAPAVLLGNGKVFIAGGYLCDSNGNCASLQSGEIYDPTSATFSSAGNMTVPRDSQTMTLLSSGQVLLAGGENCTSATSCTALNAAEIYDPVARTFTATGSLNAARLNASAVALSSGMVLIAGGFNGTNYPPTGELYDPIAGTFSNTATNLNVPRANATATLLNNGRVVIAGGSTCTTPGCPTSVAELYDNGSFYYFSYPTSNMIVSRWDQTATMLTNGEVLFAGGYDSCTSSCVSGGTTELFNPSGDSFASGQALSTDRSGHTATLLTDGSVLLVGGINGGVTLSSTDSYQPSGLALPQLASITIAPSNQPMVLGTTLLLTATGADAYGDNLGMLQSVIWNSSSPSVATISNAAGSAGIVNSLAVGTTTITASVGTISTSTQVTVTAPLASITLSPSSPTVSLNSPQELQLTATGVYSNGNTTDLTAYVSWSTSNSSVATVIPNPAVPGIVAPLAVGTANITATYGSVNGSTPVTVVAQTVPTPPSITNVSPTAGTAGTQVTVAGSGFGSPQGNGIILLGSALGTVVSWNNNQVIATVNTGSSSGVAQIQQNGLSSNSIAFTVDTALISNVSPAGGLPGTQVTITGSGFGATQGSGMVWL